MGSIPFSLCSNPKEPSESNSLKLYSINLELSFDMNILSLYLTIMILNDCYRPIKVPYKWNSSTVTHEEQPIKQKRPLFPCQDNGYSRRVTSPETISAESNSYQSIKLSTYDWELSPPFSAVSGVCQEPESKYSVNDHVLPELVIANDDDEDDDEVMSSYVIEINSSFREEKCETEAIDDAIAWAKEKFHLRTNEESSLRDDGNEKNTGMEGDCLNRTHRKIPRTYLMQNRSSETDKGNISYLPLFI